METEFIGYKILIEEDEFEKGKFKIVIYDNKDFLVGTPVRGASKEKAVQQISIIRHAFLYGLEEYKRIIQNTIWKNSISVK